MVRSAASALDGIATVGVVYCDVEANAQLCEREMGGRGYYPVVKVMGKSSAAFLELQQPELPAAAVIHLCTQLLSIALAQ